MPHRALVAAALALACFVFCHAARAADSPWTDLRKSAVVGIKAMRSEGGAVFGSGVWISNRYILTAAHVVTSANSLACPGIDVIDRPVVTIEIWNGQPNSTVTFQYHIDMATDDAKKVIAIPGTDLAIIDIGGNGKPPNSLPLSLTANVGDPIWMWGYPDGNPGERNTQAIDGLEVTQRTFWRAKLTSLGD